MFLQLTAVCVYKSTSYVKFQHGALHGNK